MWMFLGQYLKVISIMITELGMILHLIWYLWFQRSNYRDKELNSRINYYMNTQEHIQL